MAAIIVLVVLLAGGGEDGTADRGTSVADTVTTTITAPSTTASTAPPSTSSPTTRTPVAQLAGPIITKPGDLLISDQQGILYTFDVESGQLTEYELPFGGNTRMCYSGPQRIAIVCMSGPIYELDLSTGELTLVAHLAGEPFDVAVDPSGGAVSYTHLTLPTILLV